MSKQTIKFICLILGTLILIAIPVTCNLMIRNVLQNSLQEIHKTEQFLQDPKVYEPVGKKLALYWQSDRSLFPDTLEPEWLPSELSPIGHGWGDLFDTGAFLEFGGGFYHFGYDLTLDRAASTPEKNSWNLALLREESEDLLLYSFTLPVKDRLSPAELLNEVLANLDEKLLQCPQSRSLFERKIELFIRFDRLPEARQTCAKMLEAMPNDWWAVLINAVLLHEEGETQRAEDLITLWVRRNECFDGYLDLAYFYHLINKPREAAAAIIKATQFDPEPGLEEPGGNVRFRGYTAGMCAYRAGDYDAVVRLCDYLLSDKIREDNAETVLKHLRYAAQHAQAGEVVDIGWADNPGPFDAIGNLELEKLTGKPLPRPTRKMPSENGGVAPAETP